MWDKPYRGIIRKKFPIYKEMELLLLFLNRILASCGVSHPNQ
jgi:hypothetical protein